MQENMLLIKEINMQRGHNKAAKRVLEAQVRKYYCNSVFHSVHRVACSKEVFGVYP